MLLLLSFITVITTLNAIIPLFFQKHTTPQLQDNTKIFPLWTILVPIYHESIKDIQKIRHNIDKINYPNLEIIFLCEEVDILATIFLKNEFQHTKEKMLIVPRIPPFTKPKACNYGLDVAQGEYITIYDVEDIPHQMQIRRALMEFNNNNCDCVQFPLEFIFDGSILSGWQRIDYLVWYNCLLPILQKLNAPLPLGGTSNHFRTSTLRKIGGWNGYNVTEDAEIGIRMKSLGLKVHYVNSFETLEPTVVNLFNLVLQRVRWCKGHFITFFVSIFLLRKMPYNILYTFFVLFSNVFCYISYIFILLFYDIFKINNGFEMEAIIWLLTYNVGLFFVRPLIILNVVKKEKKKKMFFCAIIYNIYTIFYIIPIIKAIVEAITKPSVWYKTMR